MAKQPYIPIYIGDWEQDTNMISLEAEGGLIKLTFKLWKSPTKGLLSISFSQLSILFKKDVQKTREIITELQENGVLNIEFLPENRVKIESRRMLREAEKSIVSRENGRQGGRHEKLIKSKTKAKQKLPLEYDIEYDIEFNNLKISAPDFFQAWNAFIEMRMKKKAIPTSHAADLLKAELQKLAPENLSHQIEILNQSTSRNYTGLFPLKTDNSQQSKFADLQYKK